MHINIMPIHLIGRHLRDKPKGWIGRISPTPCIYAFSMIGCKPNFCITDKFNKLRDHPIRIPDRTIVTVKKPLTVAL